MTEEQRKNLFDELIADEDIIKEIRLRKMEVYQQSLPNGSALLKEQLEEGWELGPILKTLTKVTKKKSATVLFEDKVWTLFALLGFVISTIVGLFVIFISEGLDRLQMSYPEPYAKISASFRSGWLKRPL